MVNEEKILHKSGRFSVVDGQTDYIVMERGDKQDTVVAPFKRTDFALSWAMTYVDYLNDKDQGSIPSCCA